MDEIRFWSMIEAAWSAAPQKVVPLRARLIDDKPLSEAEQGRLAKAATKAVVPALEKDLRDLRAADLLAFDRLLERKLHELDRQEIQEYTDGSDDGFLYCRGFIVAMGQSFCEAVLKDPSKALMDQECEELCYLPLHIYEELYGDFPPSDISRESGRNTAGWQ